jgi:hypothetical protein
MTTIPDPDGPVTEPSGDPLTDPELEPQPDPEEVPDEPNIGVTAPSPA